MLEQFSLNDSVWSPQSDEQIGAYYSQADELFYGGQAGGGKSHLLLGLAATAHYRSILFRRVSPNLENLLIDGHEIFGEDCFNGKYLTWRPQKKRYVRLGYMQYEKDRTNFQGRPYDLMGFDEICEFLYSQYSFVTAWNRITKSENSLRANPQQRARIVCTGNPPTDQDGAWVIDYWAPWLDDKHPNPAKPGELRWFITIGEKSIEVPNNEPVMEKGEELIPSSRTFIPAEMIHFLQDTGYRQKLMARPEPLRSMLLYGDFSKWQQDDEWQIIPTEWVLLAMDRWRHTNIPKTVNGVNEMVIDMPMTHAGVDVARGGKDQTIIAPRYGNYLDTLLVFPGKSTPDGQTTAGLVIKNVEEKTQINIDVIGVGSSPEDYLTDYGYNVNAIDSSTRDPHATDRAGNLHFKNLRAEMWWNAREMLDPDNNEDIALPDDREFLRDLTSVRWKITAQGIQVESKEELKKRIGRSPDKGDAGVYALFSKQKLGIIV